jgi:hypothetical protein
LREAFAVEGGRLTPGSDAVIVARADAKGLAEREGLDGIRSVVADLIGRASGESGSHRADQALGAGPDVLGGEDREADASLGNDEPVRTSSDGETGR